jgi:hypothetical protein
MVAATRKKSDFSSWIPWALGLATALALTLSIIALMRKQEKCNCKTPKCNCPKSKCECPKADVNDVNQQLIYFGAGKKWNDLVDEDTAGTFKCENPGKCSASDYCRYYGKGISQEFTCVLIVANGVVEFCDQPLYDTRDVLCQRSDGIKEKG